jgi:hypothetical protein
MFAPKVVRAQTNAVTSPINRLGQQRSTFATHQFGGARVEEAQILQKTTRNEATLRPLAQTTSNLMRNQPGDDHEQEIGPENATAQNEMRGILWNFGKIPIFPPERTNQPQAASPFLPDTIHPKLIIGQVDDPLEHDADSIAEQVMRIPDPNTSIAVVPPRVSRTSQTKPARTSAEIANEAPSIVHEVRSQAGKPLDAATRAFFESALGHDFSRVRVHTDANAAASARAVSAQAYTVGHNVVFADGRYAPHASAGRRLLAHELAHVRQAEGGQFTATPSVLRQPTSTQATADPQPSKVKQLVQQDDPTANHELSQLIVGNSLDNKPTAAVGPVTAGGATHRWMLRVELKRADLDRSGAVRGKTDPEIVSTALARTKSGAPTQVHEIHIAINKWLGSSPEESAAHPDLQERMNYMAAQTLLHELIHARLEIDKSLAGLGVSALSKVGADFQHLQARLTAARAEQATVRSHAIRLLAVAGGVVGRPLLNAAQASSFADETADHLLEEKFAKQTAGGAFGMKQSISNAATADAYGDQVERVVLQMAINIDFTKGNALKVSNAWNNDLAIFKAAVKAFYDKVDAAPSPAPQGAQSGAAPSATPIQPPQRTGPGTAPVP